MHMGIDETRAEKGATIVVAGGLGMGGFQRRGLSDSDDLARLNQHGAVGNMAGGLWPLFKRIGGEGQDLPQK